MPANRLGLAALMALAALTAATMIAYAAGVRMGLLLLIGIGYGIGLCSVAFGFTTGWRAWIVERDPKGIYAQFVMIVVASALCLPLLQARPDELSPAGGPIAVCMVLGAFVFGIGIQIADGCGSGTLYKAGQGHPFSLVIFPLFVAGSLMGSLHLDWWLSLGSLGPVSLPQKFGAGVTWMGQTAVLGVLAALMWKLRGTVSKRWVGPGIWWAAIGLALLATLNLIVAGQPWGIVYGFGLWGAKLLTWGGADLSANGFWGREAQQLQLVSSVLTDTTTVTSIGLLAGSMGTALWQRKLCPAVKITRTQWIAGIIAGFVLGYTSRLAFGCNIGAYFSGISTGSLHGWVWLLAGFAGSLLGVRLRRRLGFSM